MKKFLFFLLVLFLLSGVAVYAHESKNGKSEVKINIRNRVNNSSNNFRLQINNNKFHLWGKVSKLEDKLFVIDGVNIKYDPSLVVKFKQKGEIKIGSTIKVQGEVKDNQFIAEKIDVKDQDDDDEDKDELEDQNENKTTPTPIPTEAVNNPTPSVIPTTSITPAPTSSIKPEEVKMNIKIKGGTFEGIIKFLENLLSLFRSNPNV